MNIYEKFTQFLMHTFSYLLVDLVKHLYNFLFLVIWSIVSAAFSSDVLIACE